MRESGKTRVIVLVVGAGVLLVAGLWLYYGCINPPGGQPGAQDLTEAAWQSYLDATYGSAQHTGCPTDADLDQMAKTGRLYAEIKYERRGGRWAGLNPAEQRSRTLDQALICLYTQLWGGFDAGLAVVGGGWSETSPDPAVVCFALAVKGLQQRVAEQHP